MFVTVTLGTICNTHTHTHAHKHTLTQHKENKNKNQTTVIIMDDNTSQMDAQQHGIHKQDNTMTRKQATKQNEK